MNKLLLSRDDELSNIVIEEDTEIVLKLTNCNKSINVIIEKDVCVNLLEISDNTNNTLIFTLKENSRLICNRAIKNSNDNISINLDGINASLVINNSVVNTTTSVCNFDIRHSSSNTSSKLSNHGINSSTEDLEFDVNVYISNDSKECITTQENKIVNTNCGKSKILPNLIVDNDDVNAAHSAFISDFDKEVLFYMKSRGLTEKQSRVLLKESFIIGNLEYIDDYIEEIKKLFL